MNLQPRLDFVQCLNRQGLHRMAYWEWGDASHETVVVCVHGLTRQGRDFDTLARALADRCRVVCPDVVGRGRSDHLEDPSGYNNFQYVADMVTLLARVNARRVLWVGTSMGGLIGLGVASLAGSPVEKLVLNDVGPKLDAQALARIASYLGKAPAFASVEDAADYMWSVSSSFGPHTREQWLELSRPMVKPAPSGTGCVMHYDPKIAVPFAAFSSEALAAGEQLLWKAYDSLRCPTLLVRGSQSDLLAAETAAEMTARGPKARLVEFEGVGHAPTFVPPGQIEVVREFLLGP